MMMVMVMIRGGILGSRETIHIGMRWMNPICSLRIMIFLCHLWEGKIERVKRMMVVRVGKIVMVVGRLKRVSRMKRVNRFDDDANLDMARNDILTSPPKSDEEYEIDSQSWRKHVSRRSEFHMTDMGSLDFVVGKKFPSIKVFRDAVRESNVNIGKDVYFKKNYLAKYIVVCRDTNCKYRIYGR